MAATVPVVSALVERGIVPPSRQAEAFCVVDQTLAEGAHSALAHPIPSHGSQSHPLRSGDEPSAAPLRRRFSELAGYVGGSLVVAAGALFVANEWESLTLGLRVGLLLLTAVILAAAGAAITVSAGGRRILRSGSRPVQRRLAGVLLSGAAVAVAAAVGVAVEDAVDNTFWQPGLATGLALLILAVAGYAVAPSLLGQLTAVTGACLSLGFALEALDWTGSVTVGMTFLALGVGWAAVAERGVWREVTGARIIGCALALIGAQVPLGSQVEWVAYVLTGLVAAVGFALYVVRRAWPYLAAGVIGVTLAVPEALLDLTNESLGTAGVLLVAGATLLGASLVGLRLRQEVTESGPDVRRAGLPEAVVR